VPSLRRLVLGLATGPVVAGVLGSPVLAAGGTSINDAESDRAIYLTVLLLVLLIAGRMFGERVTRRQLGLGAAAVLGVAIVVLAAGSSSGASLAGDLLAVANLIVFTVYFLVMKRVRDDDVHSWSLLAAVMTVATCVALPWAALTSHDPRAIGGTDWLLILLMIVGPGLMGHGLMTWAQRHLDVMLASLLTLASPVVSAVGAWVIYGQALRVPQMAGAAIVLGALAGIVMDARDQVIDEATEAALAGPGETIAPSR
jgi:drug/metabolite transporter (DMT)-like permease